MTEQFQNSPVPQAAIDSEIARSIAPLQDYQEKPGIGYENQRLVGERILQVADIVRDSTARVATDIGKSPYYRAEYDPERAHLIALATGKNMTHLTASKQRQEAG